MKDLIDSYFTVHWPGALPEPTDIVNTGLVQLFIFLLQY